MVGIVMKKTFLGAVRVTENLLSDFIFMCDSRIKPTYFTRIGSNKFTFQNIILFSLSMVKKSIQLELDDFFDLLNPTVVSVTKQGFSDARQKVSPTAFIKLADAVTDWFYDDDSFKKFKDYRLSAIDGSIVELNNSKRLRDAFGYVQGSKTSKSARAMTSSIYDLENNIIMTAIITRYTSPEREIAIQLIEKLIKKGLKNDLILFDRGYPSRKFIAYLETVKINFLMRVPNKSTMKEIMEATMPDQIVSLKVDGKVLPMRVLRFDLDSGIEEVLVTSLLDPSLTVQDFKSLYFKRWAIETKYSELKNKLQIENFTGDTVISVEQDFYASVYLANMLALVKQEADEKISQEDKSKQLKHDYQVNVNILIGKLKIILVQLFLEDQLERRESMFFQIMQEISRNKVPIRPGRSFTRKKGIRANRNSLNQKRAL